MKYIHHHLLHQNMTRRIAMVLLFAAMHIVLFIDFKWAGSDFSFLGPVLSVLSLGWLLLLLFNVVIDIKRAKGAAARVKAVAAWLLAAAVMWGLLYVAYRYYDENRRYYPNDFPYSCTENSSPNYCATIEDHAKVDVANMAHTQLLVKQYGSDKVTVRALAYDYISDVEYIARLLGSDYAGVHCIIYVDWPGGQLVYLETSHHTYERFTPEEFNKVLSGASEEDRLLLLDNLH